MGAARPPAVVGCGIAGSHTEGGVVVLQGRAVLSQFGVGAGSLEVGVGIIGVQGDDPAVVLRRSAMVPKFAVCQSSGEQGFGVSWVLPDLLGQALDHPQQAFAARGVHHSAVLAVVLRWLA